MPFFGTYTIYADITIAVTQLARCRFSAPFLVSFSTRCNARLAIYFSLYQTFRLRSPEARATWQCYNHAEQRAAAQGRWILRVNLDETAVCLFPGGGKGAVLISKKRAREGRPQVVEKWKKRCYMTHVAMICDQSDIQPKLPQFVLGNERTLKQRDMRALRGACPPNVTLLRQKSAWSNAALTARIVRELGRAVRLLGARTASVRIVLILDAARIHFHPLVLRACRAEGIWAVFVPAKMTWLLQPLDTHAFALYKSELQQQYQRARLASARAGGDLDVGEFLVCLYNTLRRVLQGRRWASVFDRDGYGVQQSGLGGRLRCRLQLETLDAVPATRPPDNCLRLCFPRRARVAFHLIWETFDAAAPPRASRLLGPAASHAAAAAAPPRGCMTVGVRLGAVRPPLLARTTAGPASSLETAGGAIYGRTRTATRRLKALDGVP